MRLSSRPRLTLALMVLSLVAGCASSTDVEVRRLQARSLYEQGLKYLSERQLAPGLASLREAVGLDPDNPVFRNTLGVLLLELRKPAEAQAEFRRAVELEPTYAEAHHNLGLSFAEQGRYEDAIASYKKALSLPIYPTPEVGYYNLGRAYTQLGRLREAEEALRTSIRLDPRLAPAHYQLGVVLAASDRREDAKSEFRKARDLEPGSPFGQAAADALKKLGDDG